MHFHLTEEQAAIQDAVRGTLAENWPMERLHAFSESDADFDPQSWQALMALGLGGILLPDSGMGLLDAALASQIAGEAAAPGPLIGQMLAVHAVAHSANPAVAAFLDDLVEGVAVATLALDGSDYVQSANTARFFLTGSRNGPLELVEAGAGVTITPMPSTDRSRPLASVTFDGAVTHQLFAAGDPFVARVFDAALVLVAADALGGAQKCTDMSVAYAQQREQFGQPIGRFQALKHQLAQMALDVEPAHAFVWYAAYAWDAQLPDAARAAAMAKAHLADVFVRCTRAAVGAHGGIGYTWEYGLNYWFRRAILDRAWLGSPGEHRARAAQMAGW
ncbi:MAG: acyl-CoA/acyl-ACP dehydrogenase [Blastomonas fulva]|uniref:acyl-CoA dehydrogenase family protein n=1 Tax=Blastomonas fulva TaxID=1550728 RepID=UPI0024E21B86|nr:acyl-CoA dehydrogenase family protein [Blastomonas fulva]MDK2756070.1 acyl-CoA/acyl-ACP dehydrogenase [Blastomonas fulva]